MLFNFYCYNFRLLNESTGQDIKKKIVVMCGRQSSKIAQKIHYFPLSVGRTVNMMGHHCCDYVTLYGKRDAEDLNKVSNQLTLN